MDKKEYIEREAAIRAHCDGCVDDGYCGKLDGRYACEDVPNIMAIPAADVRPVVRGKWLPTKDDNKKRCSNCDVITLIAQYPFGEANFCPNCGADMRQEKEGDGKERGA